MRGSKPGGQRGSDKGGDYYLLQSTCKKRWGQPSSSWVQQQQQQLQLPYRAACCTMRKIGAEINELAPRRAAVGLQPGPGPQLQAQPVSCAPLLSLSLSLYTIYHIPYAYSYLEHALQVPAHTKLASTIGQQNMPKNFSREQSKFFAVIKHRLFWLKWTV